MIIITILTLIVAIGLQDTQQSKITPILFSRITSIMLIYAAILTFNMLYLDIIESGLGIFSGYFQVSNISLSLEIFIYLIGALILMPWYPNIFNNKLIWEIDKEKANTLKLKSPSHLSLAPFGEGVAGVIELNDKKVDNISVTHPHTGNRWENFYDRVVKYNRPVLSEYALIILFTTLGGVLLISSYDLVSMYLSIELQSFALYLLASLYRDSESATSAGLKYFLLGGLSSCFILLGAGLIYAYTGLTNLEALYSLFSVPNITDTIVSESYLGQSNISGHRGFLLGLILIVSGFLFKIAAAPFHNWAPDVYDQVPTIITTWLTIVPKIAIIVFLLELESGLFINSDISNITNDVHSLSLLNINIDNIITMDGNILKNLFLFSSLLSLIVGTVVGLAQYKIKRLLAYSTISHVGFLVLALAVNTEQSTESLIFYIFQYSLTNLNTFLIILVFGYSLNTHALPHLRCHLSSGKVLGTGLLGAWKNNNTNLNIKSNLDIRYISELKAQFINNPILSLSLAICLFSMAGVPPLIGFFAKQQVLYSATYSGYYFISIVAILVSVISASYYLQIIKVIHFPIKDNNTYNNTQNNNKNDSNSIIPVTNIHSMTISILTLTILLFILNPSILLNSTHLLALSIFNC